MTTVAVIPIYNEQDEVVGVLDEVVRHVDRLILVDDGSVDQTPARIAAWRRGRANLHVLRHARNRGMAQALKTGFLYAAQLVERGELLPSDIIINLDADGQHPIGEIPRAVEEMEREDLDVLLVSRDFSVYPLYKVWGNRFLTALAHAVSGFPYRDVESGFRFLRARCLPVVLAYFTGWKYSCAQEIAIITALHRLRIRNDLPVRITYYRPGTTFLDGFSVATMSFVSWLRVRLRLRSQPAALARRLEQTVVVPEGTDG